MKNFQIILVVIFIAAAIFGMLVFSGAIPLGEKAELGQGTVNLWGTFPAVVVSPLLEEFNNLNPSFVVKYSEKSSANFSQDLLEALASGVGPDMFFMPDDLALSYKDKILNIPYQSYPLSNFQNNFTRAGEVFLTSAGIMAFPLIIDPLVMYYNRNTLDANGFVYPPKNWEEMINMAPVLTKKDETNKITKSAVAFGHFTNIFHAKDIISMLFMQTGNKIVTEKNGVLASDLDSSSGPFSLPNILKFYTDFADPEKNVYSWNRSFPLSRDYFSTDNLAFYFGHASELATLTNKNPNQSFLVAEVPQIKGSNLKLTSAKVTGLAISLFSKNQNTAFIAATAMSGRDFSYKLSKSLGVAPARRDLLGVRQTDAYSPIFYASALYARSWLDPSPKDTDDIFRRMVDGVLSNNFEADEAISDANAKLFLLLSQ